MTVPNKGISNGNSKVKIEADGFTDNACSLATAILQNSLGGEVESEELKPEYFVTEDIELDN